MCWVALLLVAPTAWAQRVVLIHQPSDPPLVVETIHRLSGELQLHDFHVLLVEVDDGVALTPEELAKIAEREDAVASVAFVTETGRTSADIWLSDRVTGKTSVRTLATRSAAEAPSVLAIRAVDLLRLSLRELSGDRPLPPEIVGAHPERAPEHVREWAEPEEPKRAWEVRTEVAALTPAAHFHPGLGVAVGVGRRLVGPLSLRGVFAGPSQGGQLTAGGASAHLQQIVGQIEVGLGFEPVRRLELEGTASVGVHHLQVMGDARAPLVPASGDQLSFAGGLGVGAAFTVAPGVGFGVSLRGFGITPSTVVVLGDEERALGAFVLMGSAGLRVSF